MGVVDIRIFDAIPQFGDFRNIYSIFVHMLLERSILSFLDLRMISSVAYTFCHVYMNNCHDLNK